MDSNNENISKTMTLLSSLRREIVTMQSDTVSMETLIANLFKYFAVLQKEVVVSDVNSSGLQGKLEEIFQSLIACKDLVLSHKSSGEVILRQADLVGESCLQTKSERTHPTSSDAVSDFESLENSLTAQDIKNINTGNDSDDNEYASLDHFACLDDIVKNEGVSDDPLGNQSSEGVDNQSSEWLGNQSPQVFGNQSLNVLNESSKTHNIPPQEVTNSEITHLQSHSQDKNKDTLRCKECKKNFNSKRALAYHLHHSKAHAKKMKEAKMSSKTRKSTKKPVSETISSKSKLKPNSNKKQKSNCTECGKCFTTVKELKAHMVQKHKGGKYTCGQCDKAYRSKAGLEYHLKDSNAHKNDERQILVSENDSKLAEELVSNDDTKEKSVSNHHTKDKLAALTKEKLEPDIIEKKYSCNVCGKGYKSRKGLQYHKKKSMHFEEWKSNDVLTQSGDKESNDGSLQMELETTLADECIEGKTTPTKSSKAKKKAIRGSRENRVSCEKCGREFYNPPSLRRHQKDGVCVRKSLPPTIKDFSCPICTKKCSTKHNQIIHMQNIHGNPVKETCEVCGVQVFKLKKHMALHEEKKQYSCPHCDKEFRWKEGLLRHMDQHTGIKPHMCEICGKAYTEKESLKYHMAGHVNSKNQFPCDVCGKGFMHKGLLRTHKKLHSDANVRCKICLKSFKRKEYLKAHMVMHSDEKNFKCKICGEMFKYHSVMRRHILKHKGLKPYVCPHCGKAFLDSFGRRQHLERCPHRDRKTKEDRDGKSVSQSLVAVSSISCEPASQAALSPVHHVSPIACEPVLTESAVVFEPLVDMNIVQFVEHVSPLT